MKKFYPILMVASIALLAACGEQKKDSTDLQSAQSTSSSSQIKQSQTSAENQTVPETSTSTIESTTISNSSQEETSSNQSAQGENTWASMDEAIEFYEATYKNTENEISKDIAWNNYDRKCWSLTKQEGDTIVLHWSNIGGAGGSYCKFVKDGENTQLFEYDGNASYPDNPTKQFTIQNSNHKVL
ncbi:hypothetical protein IGI37_002226 [Enterococcus sp. AZ194]|uniref:hypothetical protein n=1 Tax=Enterococcus sp. AZ194 TaxID=2774629 RepID=UPI003F1ED5AB